MILHDFPLSSASYRVRIALNLKGLHYERRNYVLRAGEQRDPAYLAINPARLVPALEVNGTRLTQSIAIIEYLDAIAPEPALIPREPVRRAEALSLALTIACDIHPLNNLRVLRYLEDELGLNEAHRKNWYAHWIALGFAAVEKTLGMRGERPFAGGSDPGIEMCAWFPRFSMPVVSAQTSVPIPL